MTKPLSPLGLGLRIGAVAMLLIAGLGYGLVGYGYQTDGTEYAAIIWLVGLPLVALCTAPPQILISWLAQRKNHPSNGVDLGLLSLGGINALVGLITLAAW